MAETLAGLLDAAWRIELGRGSQDLRFVRLVAAAWSLYLRHRVDAKGRCRHCPRRRGWLGWWGGWRFDRRRTGQCTVLATLSFYLMQPTEVVLRDLPRRVSVKP